LHDESNPDWLPSLHLGHAKRKCESRTKATERWERRKARNENAQEMEAAQLLGDTEDATELEETETGVATQTELTSANVRDMQREIEDLTIRLTQRVAPFSEESLQSNEMVKFYTGLPNMKVLTAVFGLVIKAVYSSDTTRLSPFQEFMATLVKLRLNCQVQDLAYRLNLSCATVSRIFLKWMTVMDKCLCSLILWPDHDSLSKTMPECFRASFGTKVAVIIDCFEILSVRPISKQGHLHGHLTNTIILLRFYLGSRLKEWYPLFLNAGVAVSVISISLNSVAY
jgi:hypothetical protein